MAKKSERSVEVQDRKMERDHENTRRHFRNKQLATALDIESDKRPSKALRKFVRANNPALDRARADAAQNKAKAVAKAKLNAKVKRAEASLALERDVLTAIHHASEKVYTDTDSMHVIDDVQA